MAERRPFVVCSSHCTTCDDPRAAETMEDFGSQVSVFLTARNLGLSFLSLIISSFFLIIDILPIS